MISLPIRLSKKYQVNQVNHEVAKKHHKHSTYNKPNILILIKIPCKYLVIIIPFPKVIPPCNYLVNHLFLLIYPQTTRMANMMMTIMCTRMPNKYYLDCVESGLLKCSSNRKIISSLIDLVAAIRVPFILMDTSVVNNDGSIILNVSDNA